MAEHREKLLRLASGLLQGLHLLALGHVARDLGETAQLAVRRMKHGQRDVRPEERAVLAHAPALILHGALLARLRKQPLRFALSAIVRGIRAVSDYEYEFQMALMNRHLEPSLETVFMMPAEQYTYLSSRLIKEVFSLGGQVSGLVPPSVETWMRRQHGKQP